MGMALPTYLIIQVFILLFSLVLVLIILGIRVLACIPHPREQKNCQGLLVPS